ncbi:MAG: Ig-like domain-containing protein, partial [Longicatena sp.]|nr:Ig-like domain-containing protein [Longicatena sp.]
DGSFTYDYTDFDAWVSFCKEMGLGDTIIVYSIAPWHNSFTYWENGQIVKEPYSVGSTRYNTVVKDFLQDLIEHLMAKGWFDNAYVGFDERGVDQRAFDVIRSVKNIHGKSLKIQSSIDNLNGKKAQALSVDFLNVGDFAAEQAGAIFDEILATRNAQGLRTTLYSCTEHRPGNFSLSAPVESYWSTINAGRYADGFNRWAFDAWVEDPLRDATHNAFEAGDCFSIFPDEKDAQNPISRWSVRLARMAQGVRDTNKLRLMVKEAPDLQDEVDALYNALTTVATKNTTYMNDSQKAALAAEMDTFETGLMNICRQYNELLATGTNDVEAMEIADGNFELELGASKKLTLSFTPENVINKNVIWTSSNPAVISVSENGTVTANRLGSATITAVSVLDSSLKASITVKGIYVPVAEDAQVSYYSFDDEDGTDSWGTRNGTINNATFVDGKAGKAISVTETNNMTFASANPFSATDSWSIGYYVYSTVDLTGRHSVLMNSSKTHSFDLKMAADRKSGYHVGTGSGDVLTFEHAFEKGVWYHVMWTQSKAEGLSMYVNGVKNQTNTWTKTGTAYAPIDIIGGTGFVGYIDEIKVYNRVLTADEVKVSMMNSGLNLTESAKTLNIGETYLIEASLITSGSVSELTYVSSDETIASVDQDGLVTAHKKGTATITVSAGNYSAEMTITVEKKVNTQNVLDRYILDEKYQSDVEKAPGTERQYLGQPDMVRTRSGRLITAFPQGHGKGPIVMKFSDDDGESWYEYTATPESWKGSQETPTLYILNLADGTERIMMITACPGWGVDSDGNRYGWNTSYSDDNGETWTEYKHWYSKLAGDDDNDCIVAMASLVQLKDEDGNYKQEWLGNFHNYSYQNYKTILSFDENGNEQWSEPEFYLDEYRSIESTYQMCEIGMFRSPDGKRIIGLARSQSHNNPSTLIYSDDEGETWSKPMDLPGSLAGERHKALYDPISGRLVITFREIKFDLNGNGTFDGGNDWTCGEWLAWVGTYDQLMNQEDGDYVIELDADYANNAKSGDTGYTGMVVLEDGTFILDTYGHWDQQFSLSWGGGVTTDLCWIRQAKFKLGNVESDNYLTNYSELYNLYQEVKDYKSTDYTGESYLPFTVARDLAAKMIEARDAQQSQVDELYTVFSNKVDGLVPATNTLDKTALEAIFIKVYGMTEREQYTDDSIAALNGAFMMAMQVYTSEEATQADVDLAAAYLQQAYDSLELKPVEVLKTGLIAAIDSCADEIANEEAYNAESFAAFMEVYNNAVAVR